MQDLIQQEKFELEVLDRLNSKKLLTKLVFGGGTMLRLCYGLNRFSVDLDFWITENIETAKLYKDMREYLSQYYSLTDSAEKYFTLLFEIRAKEYPRSLKLEIRKERKEISIEKAIAYSKYSNQQVILPVVSLKDMMRSKIEAFIDRKEIRDAFDMEFLVRKGIELDAPKKSLEKALKILADLTNNDFKVKLGQLLEASDRKYYLAERFKTLEYKIKEKLI